MLVPYVSSSLSGYYSNLGFIYEITFSPTYSQKSPHYMPLEYSNSTCTTLCGIIEIAYIRSHHFGLRFTKKNIFH